MEIDEIGERIAESIVEFFSKPEHLEMIEFLKKQGLQFQVSEELLSNRTQKLKGLNIVISGTFEKHSREELKGLIEQHGGKNVGSISKKTNFLLAGENMGPSKLEKAQNLGIPIISEDEFLKMLGDS
jgi:DNA ligase (NAD+)